MGKRILGKDKTTGFDSQRRLYCEGATIGSCGRLLTVYGFYPMQVRFLSSQLMRTIYVLMEDCDGTFWSKPQPTGKTVDTEEEAKEWVKKGSWLGQRDYCEERVE